MTGIIDRYRLASERPYYRWSSVPLTQTPVVLDPNSFRPPEGITQRYSREALESGRHYYRTLNNYEAEVNWQKEGF